jgi:thermitase
MKRSYAARKQPKENLMKLRKALLAVTLVVLAFTTRSSAQTVSAGPSVAGEILVKFRPSVTANAKADAHRLARGAPRSEIVRTGVQLVAVPAGDRSAAIARYQSNPNVLYAEPNFIRSIPVPSSHTPGSEVVPSDYYFHEQWALHNTGQQFYCIPWIFGDLCLYGGTADADIDAPEAWAISTGSPAVTVAVIDSGIDYTHPDLAANYAGGYNFVSGDSNPMDDHGHGTHVSGTIAAALDNLTGDPAAAEGVVGVAPNARILAYKVCSSDGTCSDFAIVQALAQAITDGAKVINMSLGGPDYSRSLDDAVQNAWNAGLVIVAAAGNDGTTVPFYPAALDNVISVAAFDEDGNRAPFSNYGSWVDISAPGNVIMSTYPLAACAASGVPGNSGCYTWLSGTSMAAPHVSGAAALVWSRSDVTTNRQVVDILLRSADPKGVASVRLDSWTVHGGLNLHDALSFGLANLPPVASAGADQTLTDNDGNGAEFVTLDGSASVDPDGSIVRYEWREGGSVIGFGATPAFWLFAGIHTFTLDVTDNYGAIGTDTVVVTVKALNHAPVSANASTSTVVGTPVTLTLFAADLETCELVFAVVQGPTSGAVGAIANQACVAGTPSIDTGQITYTPGDTAGTFSFGYKANDGSGDSNVATVTITVNAAVPPPSAGVSVTGVNPNVVSQDAGRTTFAIIGTGFAEGASVTFENGSGLAPRVINVRRDSSTQLTVDAKIRSGGPRKNRFWDIRVTNPDGSTGVRVGLLTITP